MLHGSRSGIASKSTHDEFESTAAYAGSNPDSLGWNVTIGDDELAVHLNPDEWGWHARAASSHYLSVEFAQPVASRPVSDAQVDVFCYWLTAIVEPVWGALRHLPTHAEVEASGETGAHDGKTDVFPAGDPRADELRARIMARL